MLNWFAPFAFTGTIVRLRAAVGAGSGREWTPQQVEQAATIVDDAYRSWAAYRIVLIEQIRRHKHVPNEDRDKDAPTGSFDAWWTSYLAALPTDVWRARDLGDCDACGHPWLWHTSAGCTICMARPVGPEGVVAALRDPSRCRRPTPAPS